MSEIHKQLDSIQKVKRKLEAKENILLNKAIKSSNPSDLIKANDILKNVEKFDESDRKSFIFDPATINNYLGYKDKPFVLSYEMIRRISYTSPIIRSIILTRIDQVAAFCEPQSDKYSTGFVIRKKKPFYSENEKLNKAELKRCEDITNFVLNCGEANNFVGYDFDSFIRMIVNDSLTYDQMTFEVVDNQRGFPHSFNAVDAKTVRLSKFWDDEEKQRDDKVKTINGYKPSYVQINAGIVTAEFYPWQMCFGLRNPSTDIQNNGYGISEIEMMVNIITSMLWSDEYNRRFFSQGSSPKGLLKIKNTNISETRLAQFKQEWQAMTSGVYNSWKTPIMDGDIDWVDLQKSNQDMEFSKWQEYLIKLACSIYRIDPSEINFPLSGGAEKPMFEGNNEARLKHSKDKGLYPLLKFIQRKINKWIISRIDPDYEFIFVGMDGENRKDELEMDTKMMGNFMTIDEIRIKRGLKPFGEEKGGDIIANSIWLQNKNAMAQQQQEQQQQEQQQQQGGDEQEQGDDEQDQGDDEQEQGGGDDNPFKKYEQGEEEGDDGENPFEKAFSEFVKTL